ncbi:MAG: hypothetical protein LBG95_06850 [Treponema sp.]|jgi:hypothetical protein|nr:hypothetical protein [Treponema sp.]
MKLVLCFCLFLFSFSYVFSQYVPDEITLSYQNEIKSWLDNNSVNIKPQTKKYNGIKLFLEPYINQKYPKNKIFGEGGSVIDCLAIGKFLTMREKEKIYKTMYSCVPQDARQRFLPFKNFENFKNSLVFNPQILFAKPDNRSLIADFNGKNAYLIFYFGSYSEKYPDMVFNLQLKQLANGNNMLIIPYSFYYALFKIDDRGNIALVSYYGIN